MHDIFNTDISIIIFKALTRCYITKNTFCENCTRDRLPVEQVLISMKNFIELISQKQTEIYRTTGKKPTSVVLNSNTVDRIDSYLCQQGHPSSRLGGVRMLLFHLDIRRIIRTQDLGENEIEFLDE